MFYLLPGLELDPDPLLLPVLPPLLPEEEDPIPEELLLGELIDVP